MTNSMKFGVFIMLLLSIVSFGCSKDSSTNAKPVSTEDILTRDDEISGWKRSGGSWTAGTSGELNASINGEEPLYTRYGFVEAAMQRYEGNVLNSSATVEVRIFDQGTAENAEALFEEIVLQLVNPINGNFGDEAKTERFSLSQRLIFRKSGYFVSLTITSGLDEALDILKTFAGNVESRIQ